VNVHVKMLVFPVPEKFNTFNTFNTFDRVASCLRTEHSAVSETAGTSVV
jgi:hypothetical protein